MSTNTATSTNQEPILEAVHLRKEFPLHTVKLFGPRQAVHAVEDASLALRPGHATALVYEDDPPGSHNEYSYKRASI